MDSEEPGHCKQLQELQCHLCKTGVRIVVAQELQIVDFLLPDWKWKRWIRQQVERRGSGRIRLICGRVADGGGNSRTEANHERLQCQHDGSGSSYPILTRLLVNGDERAVSWEFRLDTKGLHW
jgi:hypothetical protein